MNFDQFLLLLWITKNLGNKGKIIIIRKMCEYILQGIKMSKTTNCECCRYFLNIICIVLLIGRGQF